MKREKLGSRIGFILISAGCAIGIGNVWRFPYIAGQNGGGIFVAFYLLFLVILGIPIMTVEFSVGRGSGKSPIKSFKELEKPGTFWHIHGYLCIVGNYILMMFYTTVAGWMLYYLYISVTGKYTGLDSGGVAQVFNDLLADPATLTVNMVIIVVAGFLIISAGLQSGLERVTKVMMVFLLVIMFILAIHSLSIEGGSDGLKFYLLPDVNRMLEVGVVNVMVAAMSQAFFTLSLGIGSMAIFGSYIDKERSLLGESINVAVLDTAVAFCSGLIIFPACFAYGVNVDSGPSLLFVTLPVVFNNLSQGRFWGTLFFLFMVFAAFSTVMAVFENIIGMTMDQFGWSRKKACYINIPVMIVLSLPCALGFNLLSGFQPLGAGSGVLDLEDYVVSNLLLPIGSMIYLLFCVTKFGWGWDHFVEEANAGKGLKIQPWMRPYMTYILPLILIFIFIMGLL